MTPESNSDELIDPQSYKLLCEQLLKKTGIDLGNDKSYLVNSRFKHLLSMHQGQSINQLVRSFCEDTDRRLSQQMIDMMTTNETNWFRDVYPYEIFKKRLLPELTAAHKGPLKVWSAACSSGQEAYSLSMAFSEYQLDHGLYTPELEIHASDISTQIIEQAKLACYDAHSLARGLSESRLATFFNLTPKGYTLKSREATRVSFHVQNLLEVQSLHPQYHLIFCRNVLIYFPKDIRDKVLKHLKNALVTGGYLVLGASEFVNSDDLELQMIKCNPGIIYQKK